MCTVLVIDDEQNVRDVAMLMLKRGGYQTLTANSAEEGLELLKSNKVDATLLDVVLPDKNGIEFLFELNQKWPKIPVVLMSGRVSTEADSIKNFNGRFGVSGSIHKPFTQEQLVGALKKAITY